MKSLSEIDLEFFKVQIEANESLSNQTATSQPKLCTLASYFIEMFIKWYFSSNVRTAIIDFIILFIHIA